MLLWSMASVLYPVGTAIRCPWETKDLQLMQDWVNDLVAGWVAIVLSGAITTVGVGNPTADQWSAMMFMGLMHILKVDMPGLAAVSQLLQTKLRAAGCQWRVASTQTMPAETFMQWLVVGTDGRVTYTLPPAHLRTLCDIGQLMANALYQNGMMHMAPLNPPVMTAVTRTIAAIVWNGAPTSPPMSPVSRGRRVDAKRPGALGRVLGAWGHALGAGLKRVMGIARMAYRVAKAAGGNVMGSYLLGMMTLVLVYLVSPMVLAIGDALVALYAWSGIKFFAQRQLLEPRTRTCGLETVQQQHGIVRQAFFYVPMSFNTLMLVVGVFVFRELIWKIVSLINDTGVRLVDDFRAHVIVGASHTLGTMWRLTLCAFHPFIHPDDFFRREHNRLWEFVYTRQLRAHVACGTPALELRGLARAIEALREQSAQLDLLHYCPTDAWGKAFIILLHFVALSAFHWFAVNFLSKRALPALL
jgi:hypothetical protein